jgi:molecular chaperone IbpA
MVRLKTYGGLADFENFWLGHDRFMTQFLEEVKPYAEVNYPRYNIVKTDGAYWIEMSLAGWTKKDLQVVLKENILTITGDKDESHKKYIHKGVSGKAFKRVFTLADHLKVVDVKFQDGMLEIALEDKDYEEKKPQTLKIR